MYWRRADGKGSEELLTTGGNRQNPGSWTPDGKSLAYDEGSPKNGDDIWVLQADGSGKPIVFLQTPYAENTPKFSPDGRWLAYVSNESGRNDIYVQPFPGPGGKWQISSDGGRDPLWARSGKELFYRDGNKMMAVEITTSPTFAASKSTLLFEGEYKAGCGDVSPDGRRFLMVQAVERVQPATQIGIVLNWLEEIKRLTHTGK